MLYPVLKYAIKMTLNHGASPPPDPLHTFPFTPADCAASVVPMSSSPVRSWFPTQIYCAPLQPRGLDRLNTELGFLHPHPKREDLGKFTSEGRYRVWKEIWTLNYLGRAARYE